MSENGINRDEAEQAKDALAFLDRVISRFTANIATQELLYPDTDGAFNLTRRLLDEARAQDPPLDEITVIFTMNDGAWQARRQTPGA